MWETNHEALRAEAIISRVLQPKRDRFYEHLKEMSRLELAVLGLNKILGAKEGDLTTQDRYSLLAWQVMMRHVKKGVALFLSGEGLGANLVVDHLC